MKTKNQHELAAKEATTLMMEYRKEYPNGGTPTVRITKAEERWSLFVANGVGSLAVSTTLPIQYIAGALEGVGFRVESKEWEEFKVWWQGCSGCPHEDKSPCPLQFSEEPCPPHGQTTETVVFKDKERFEIPVRVTEVKHKPKKKPDPQRIKRIKRGEPADSVDQIRWAWKEAGGRLPEEPPKGELVRSEGYQYLLPLEVA